MGWEVELFAIPSTWKLLEAVANNEINPELLVSVGLYLNLRRTHQRRVSEFARGDADYAALADIVEEMIDSHPGIEHRHLNLDRRFDWLQWLLVEGSRNDLERQIAAEAIRGESPVPVARSTQGFLILKSSTEKVGLINLWLSELTTRSLRQKYDPQKMDQEGLYKWDLRNDPDLMFDQIAEDFAALQRFYSEVSARSESVLVIKD